MFSLISTTKTFDPARKAKVSGPKVSESGRLAPGQRTAGETVIGSIEVPAHVDPVQWHQATGYARQVCARFFRDGAGPADAMQAFGLEASTAAKSDWGRAVSAIAHALCTGAARRAA